MIELGLRGQIAGSASPFLTAIGDMEVRSLGSVTRLYAGSEALGGIATLTLAEGQLAAMSNTYTINGRGSGFRLGDMEFFQDGASLRLLISDIGATHLERYTVSASSGTLSGATAMSYASPPTGATSEIATVTVAGKVFVAAGQSGQPGLSIFEVQGSQLQLRHQVADTPKIAVGDVGDLATVTVGTATYLFAGSMAEGALSTFSISDTGQAALVDTIGAKEGLWLGGLSQLATVEALGIDYMIVGATNSSSLSVVRVNPLGVMFVTDHVTDTLETRFANVGAVAGFSVNGRGFVLAGGSDDGLTLMELLPDGRLHLHQSIESLAGWSLTDVAAITVKAMGSEVQVFAAGSTPGLMQFTLPVANIAAPLVGTEAANVLTGTGQDDLIFGQGGNDTLKGMGGDDLLIGGLGADLLYGGSGADVFIADSGPNEDRVMDFELGADRIDLSAWGPLYHVSGLTITSLADGARVSANGHSLRLTTMSGTGLTAGQFTQDDFVF